MKSKISFLFFLLLGVLLLSNLGLSVKEGYVDRDDSFFEEEDDEDYILPEAQNSYILKSEIVPPVCPKCPDVHLCPKCGGENNCQPCPPCGRCPKPAFKCAKVPDYNSVDGWDELPRATLADFSQFSDPKSF